MSSRYFKELQNVDFISDELDYLVFYPKKDFIESVLNPGYILLGNCDFYNKQEERIKIKEKQRKEIKKTIKNLESDIFISTEPEIIEKEIERTDPLMPGNSIGWKIKFKINWDKCNKT